MKKIKDYIKKYSFLAFIIVIVILALGIPLLINIAFKTNWGIPWLQAEWDADDALNFYGSLLGAIVAILGVKWTIASTLKLQESDRILQAKPCLYTSTFLISTDAALEKLDGPNTWFIFNTPSKCESQKGIPSYLNRKPYNFDSECMIKYTISNIGSNTATRLEMFLEGIPSLPQIAMPVNSTITVVLVLVPKENESRKDYTIRLRYGDIVSESVYSQKESLTVVNNGNDLTYEQKLEQSLSSPELEEK